MTLIANRSTAAEKGGLKPFLHRAVAGKDIEYAIAYMYTCEVQTYKLL